MKAVGGTSKGELTYTLEGVAADLRADGRGRLDYRHLTLELALFPHTAGSARLSLGGTDVVVGVTAELAEPDAATPDEGRIVVSVGASAAMAEDELLALEAALQSLYAHNVAAAALRALCIVPGAQCWQLRAHAQLLVAEGWPLDALALAVNAALHNTRVPKVVVEAEAAGAATAAAAAAAAAGGGGAAAPLDLDLDESLDESLPFDASGLPVYVTLATIGAHFVADCTTEERRAAGCALSLALDARGRVCAIRAGGGYGVQLAPLADMLQTARALGAALVDAARAAFASAAAAAEKEGAPMSDSGLRGLLAT